MRGEHELEESIRLILATSPGERPMRPEFGCAVNDYVFAPADAGTAGQLAYEVRLALERWEPRIEVTEVVVRFDEADNGVLYIDIGYRARRERPAQPRLPVLRDPAARRGRRGIGRRRGGGRVTLPGPHDEEARA